MSTGYAPDFGDLLKKFRTAKSMTQEELAERAGLSVHGISDLERGARRWPRRATLDLIASALHLTDADHAILVAAARRPIASATSGQITAVGSATTGESASHTSTPPIRNAPMPMTPLIGREAEVQIISDLLQGDTRLLTITGPGGIGKTRVALQVASSLGTTSPDGVYFVGLAAIREPDLVVPAIAQALGVMMVNGQSPLAALIAVLRERRTVLLLDNFEQITAAAPSIGSLLTSCPHLKILVTSRAALHLAGEQEYLLPPLAGPDPHQLPDVASLAAYPAIALFLQRAQAVKPDLVLTETNGPAVAEICARLDGLPLAIELAAARIRILPPRTLLRQLDRRLTVLTGGPYDAPERQQTLQNTIAWSYELLTPREQTLFRRLAVFAGGFDLEAAEQVCLTDSHPDLNLDLLDGMSALVDHHLLWQAETATGEARFGMLETIREYGQEWLDASGEAETLRRQHAEYYTTLAEQGDALLMVSVQRRTLDFLDQEHSNFRAALRWALEQQEIALGLRIAGALARFWKRRGYTSEGRQWLTQCLQLAESQHATIPPLVQIRALTGAGRLAWGQSDYASAKQFCEASIALSMAHSEKREAAHAYLLLGNVAYEQGDSDAEIASKEACLRLCREVGDKRGMAAALGNLVSVALKMQDYRRAEQLCQESIQLFRELDDKVDVAIGISHLGDIARMQGNYQRADTLYAEGITLSREIGDKAIQATNTGMRGYMALEMRQFEQAEPFLRAAIVLARELDRTWVLIFSIVGLGIAACGNGQPERGARWLGAAEAAREAAALPIPHDDQPLYERTIAALRAALGEERLAACWGVGRTLTLDQVIAEALGNSPGVSAMLI